MTKSKVILFAAVILVMLAFNAQADVAVGTEVQIQTMRLYEGKALGSDFEIEAEAQTYLLAAEILLGPVTITPKAGVQNLTLDVAEIVELDNDLGLAGGVDIAYDIVDIGGFMLSLEGSYLYSQSEVDEVKILANDMTITNPARNEVKTHSYEAALLVRKSFLDDRITPYVGIAWADADLDITTDNLPINIEVESEAANNLGLRAGVKGQVLDSFFMSLDLKLLDRTEIVLAGAYTF